MSVKDIFVRAQRVALMGQIIRTYDSEDDRRAIVIGFQSRGILSDEAADLLLDEFGLDSVQ